MKSEIDVNPEQVTLINAEGSKPAVLINTGSLLNAAVSRPVFCFNKRTGLLLDVLV